MKIGLFGYGKMGKTIERIAIDRGHEIVCKIRSESTPAEKNNLQKADVIIEFTRPESALENFSFCLEHGLKTVTGTTGWYDQKAAVQQQCDQKDGTFFWASNFSIGVNLFWEVNKKLASLMVNYPAYKVSMDEIHHTQKLDEPSGTAITTAEQIIAAMPNITEWKLSNDNPSDQDLNITSFREGDVKGTHLVKYESEVDKIELKHEAKTREGFALGAVLAAEFVQNKKGFLTMSDLLGL
jgi:4-hydroxy-tetrahydrodipicolinate reductase